MLLVGTVLGIQFMVASAEDKAEVKKALVPYVIGCIVIFGAFTIWSIAVNIGQDITSGSSGASGSSGSSDTPSYKLPYTVTTGTWYWCTECDRELTENEKRDQHCSKSRSHHVKKITERYYCSKCGDEWDESEKRQQACDNCRSR